MNHNRIVLPPNILELVYSGGDVSRGEDSVMSRLINLSRDFPRYSAAKPADLEDISNRIEAATIELEVRTAGARLVQAAYYIAAGKLDLATTSFETAKQLFDSAHTRATGSFVAVSETTVLQSLAVVGYQLMQAREAASKHSNEQEVAQ